MTVLTVYLPFAAVQVPRRTGAVVWPAAMAPVWEPVSVLTVAPLASWTVRVMPWAPDAEATEPWFFRATVNVTSSPAEALVGVQETGAASRSELATGLTTRASGRV